MKRDVHFLDIQNIAGASFREEEEEEEEREE
jgi:hypothetical protein